MVEPGSVVGCVSIGGGVGPGVSGVTPTGWCLQPVAASTNASASGQINFIVFIFFLPLISC
jgi:hypothetical protein